ncbi:hypothetical protein HERIO_234 [Hepatospora eriocheir]|uniref:Uncharacterized protein n=1 Tax=Hepatospora eriocheir TaxID=1081669 RepID=A0A1X0QDP2_9MICR|nr:hypothetical protein HERIO_234 [Hepatospora eriocheir]
MDAKNERLNYYYINSLFDIVEKYNLIPLKDFVNENLFKVNKYESFMAKVFKYNKNDIEKCLDNTYKSEIFQQNVQSHLSIYFQILLKLLSVKIKN